MVGWVTTPYLRGECAYVAKYQVLWVDGESVCERICVSIVGLVRCIRGLMRVGVYDFRWQRVRVQYK